MNVIKFINSKSIADYLEKIKYPFSTIEAAYLVWQSRFTTLSERIAGWNEIINTMPDTSVPERRWAKGEASLHNFLRRYIALIDRVTQSFYREENAFYTYSVLYEGDSVWSDDGCVYPSLDLCIKAYQAEAQDYGAKVYTVNKLLSNGLERIEMTFNQNNEICGFNWINRNMGDEDADILCFFKVWWLSIPTPFKRGDIVYQCDRQVCLGTREKEPFVLTDLCTWGEKELRENEYTDEQRIASSVRLLKIWQNGGDETDMLAYGYYVDEHGRMYREHTFDSYLNLEYYTGELSEEKAFLIALSNYEKGKIDIAFLANAYRIFNDELRGTYIKKYAYFLEQELAFAGLKEIKIFIGGSKQIGKLSESVKRKIAELSRCGEILVGDCNGVDLAVQKYLHSIGDCNVTVYCSGSSPRNNVGGWRVVALNEQKLKGAEFYRLKDIRMAQDADYGFMIWNGVSKGTQQNIDTLRKLMKSVEVVRETV